MHKLANGKYRHKGTDIIRQQIATSYGFGFVYYVRNLKGHRCDTLKQAGALIDSWEEARIATNTTDIKHKGHKTC